MKNNIKSHKKTFYFLISSHLPLEQIVSYLGISDFASSADSGQRLARQANSNL